MRLALLVFAAYCLYRFGRGFTRAWVTTVDEDGSVSRRRARSRVTPQEFMR